MLPSSECDDRGAVVDWSFSGKSYHFSFGRNKLKISDCYFFPHARELKMSSIKVVGFHSKSEIASF